MEENGITPGLYLLYFLNRNCVYMMVDVKGVDNTDEVPLYMRVHYINNACNGLKEGSKEHTEAPATRGNCINCDDGSVQTTKFVKAGDELFEYAKPEEEAKAEAKENTKKRKMSEDQ
jgi:hypothetical protein